MTDCRPAQPSKAEFSIPLVSAGIIVLRQPTIKYLLPVCMIALQSLLLLYTGFAGATVMVSREEVYAKAPPVTEVREAGI